MTTIQTIEALDLNVIQMAQNLARELNTFIYREHGVFGRAAGDGDDQTVEQRCRAAHDVGMPVRDRIEGAGIDDGDAQCGSPILRWSGMITIPAQIV